MRTALRLLILEQLDELARNVTRFQKIVGAHPDGVWGPETQRAWDAFVRKRNPKVEGATIDDLIERWESYGDKVRRVNGVFAFYTPDVVGATQFLRDIIAFGEEPEETFEEPEAEVEPVLPAGGGLRAYIIGDSISVGPFGVTLESTLKNAGIDTFRAAVGGSAASGWVNNNPFPGSTKNLDTVKSAAGSDTYDIGIICLGTNDSANAARAVAENPQGLTLEAYANKFATNLNTLATTLGANTNFWVGPPALRGSGRSKWWTRRAADAMYDAALPRFNGVTYDSRWVTPGADGVHVYGAEADGWAQDVARSILSRVKL